MHVRYPSWMSPSSPLCPPHRHSPPRTHVWLGWGAAPPASPCVPPGAATPRQGTPRRSGWSSHHPTLLITLSDYKFLHQDRRLDSAAGSHLPLHPSSPRGQHGRGVALSPIFRSKSHHLQPHKGGPGALCVSPPSSTKPPGTPRPAASPPQAVPSDGGDTHTEAEGMPGSTQQRGRVPVGYSAPQKWVGEDEAPACRLSTLMNYTGLQVPGQVSRERSQRGSPPPGPLLPENLQPGLRDRLSN